jgi:hypothetical protein
MLQRLTGCEYGHGRLKPNTSVLVKSGCTPSKLLGPQERFS